LEPLASFAVPSAVDPHLWCSGMLGLPGSAVGGMTSVPESERLCRRPVLCRQPGVVAVCPLVARRLYAAYVLVLVLGLRKVKCSD